MIKDRRKIQIEASPERVFDVIDKMPNKFPVYKTFETKPLLFLRILFVDGLKSAIEAINVERPEDKLVLNIGDTIGPFTLTMKEKPLKYWFSLESFFFNCQTGYFLSSNSSGSTLYFDLIAENPNLREKMWWLLFKPFHWIFANKTLRVIKSKTM